MIFVPHRKHAYGSPRPVPGIVLLLYVDDVRASQGTRLWASTACSGDSFTLFYVGDVRTSQGSRLWSSTASYWDSLENYSDLANAYLFDRTVKPFVISCFSDTHALYDAGCSGLKLHVLRDPTVGKRNRQAHVWSSCTWWKRVRQLCMC
jgi:hypothetical protein